MMNYDNNGLLLMDCETTGLTDNDKILEVAMHITDMRGNTLMGTIHTIIHHEPDFFNDLDDSVINMHTNNGLIHDCTHAGMSVQQAERKLTDYMRQANGVSLMCCIRLVSACHLIRLSLIGKCQQCYQMFSIGWFI